MYNEGLKKQFLRTQLLKSQSKYELATAVFELSEKFEEGWGADLCTRSVEELQPFVDEITGFRARSKWSRLIILKDYARWCIVMNVPNACDGMLEITETGLDKVRTMTLSSPKALQSYLNVICSPEEQQQNDNIYRCYYWLAYSGITDDDILDIKISDVDFENGVIHYRKRDTVVPLYMESLPAIRNCVQLSSFRYVNVSYKNDIWRDRVPGDTLVRGVRAEVREDVFRKTLATLSCKHSKETPLRMSYFRVWLSGVFYRMYEKEQMGYPVDFDPIATICMEGKTYKLDSGRNTLRSKMKQLSRDYKTDYERWKLAWK